MALHTQPLAFVFLCPCININERILIPQNGAMTQSSDPATTLIRKS